MAGLFRDLPDITVRMIQRGEEAVFPPFDEVEVRPGNLLVVAATRDALTKAAMRHPGLFHPPADEGPDHGKARLDTAPDTGEGDEDKPKAKPKLADPDLTRHDQVIVEVMVTPSSRLIGQNLKQIGFRSRFKGVVLGIQRRARMIRARMTDIRLEAGDVMLVQTHPEDVDLLRDDRDMIAISGSTTPVRRRHRAKRAAIVFLGVVAVAATGLLPIVVAAVAGAAGMIAFGGLNLRQAARAIDRKVVMVVAAAIALGAALEATGGAAYLAHSLIGAVHGASPAVLLSVLYLAVALFTNVLSNNACAVLFTPIAVNLGLELGLDPRIFAITVLLAANMSFASPVGYQTNLLVMGPGQYQVSDFVRGGLPLLFILWGLFTLLAPWWWGV